MREQPYTDAKVDPHDERKEQHVIILHALVRNTFHSHFIITFGFYHARKLQYQFY